MRPHGSIVLHAAVLAILLSATAYAQGVFLSEDFSGYEIGDAATDWGPNAIVVRAPEDLDKRQFLSTHAQGEQSIEQRIDFPPSWVLGFDVAVTDWYNTIKIILIDSSEEAFPIELKGHRSRTSATMPNTVEVRKDREFLAPKRLHRIKLYKKDKALKLFVDDELFVSNNYPSLGRIDRIKIRFEAGTYFTGFKGEERGD